MAKKKETKKEVVIETPVVEAPPVVEQPKVKKKVMEKPLPKKDKWEIKDRTYVLKNGQTPLSRSIKAAGIYYFDEELGYERELKYTSNQRTVFVEEMKGDQRLDHIIFRKGVNSISFFTSFNEGYFV